MLEDSHASEFHLPETRTGDLPDRDMTVPLDIPSSALVAKVLPIQQEVLAVSTEIRGTPPESADVLLGALGDADAKLTPIELEANRTSDNAALAVLQTCRNLILSARENILERMSRQSWRLTASHL